MLWGTVSLGAAAPAGLELARQLNSAFTEVAERVSPSVVVIEVAHRPDYRDRLEADHPWLEMLPPDLRRRFQERATPKEEPPSNHPPVYSGRGSGVIIREDGWILTNHHVVQGAEKIRVTLHNGQTYEVTEGQWFHDPQSDLAVLKVPAQGLSAARLADSSQTRVGEFAIAIGAPFELDYSVTFGHVSAKGRSRVIPSWSATSPGASMDQDFIQTDASINPGNSGGPLVDIDGQVIGVNTLIHGLNRGVGFAIPSNLAKEVADQLIARGKYTRAWLGIQISALKDDLDFRGFAPGLEQGVVVKKILPDGPAAKSELRPADVITAVEGTPVGNAQELRHAVRTRQIGQPVTLDVVRTDHTGQNATLQIKVRTEEWPEEPRELARPAGRPEATPVSHLGLTVQTLTEALAEKFGVEMTQGVVVTAVEPDSAAARERVRTGDIITEVNRRPVRNPKEFREALKSGTSKGVLVHLISDRAPEYRILKGGGD